MLSQRTPFLVLRCIVFFLFVSSHLSAAEFSVSTHSYLGGPGDLEEVRGARVLSDGSIILGAVIGAAQPGQVSPRLINGASALSSAALVHLDSTGQNVLSVTRLSEEIWDIAVDASDNVYVAAGLSGLLKVQIGASSSQLIWKRAEGFYIYRVDAAPNGDVASLQPESFGPSGDVRIEDNTPGVGTVRAYHADGSLITEFDTWGGRHATDIAIFDGAGNPSNARIMWIGWRNGYAYTGPRDACGDSLVDGISTTVHIGSLFGATYDYDGTNAASELVYQAYDRGERVIHIWKDTAPADPKLRRQEHLNDEFFNGPTDITELYTLADVDAARTDSEAHNDWLWIEEDAGNSFVGCPKNIIYQEAFDWYQQGFPDSPSFISSDFLYPSWCEGRNDPAFVGNPYNPGGNNMADTRGLRLAMGRDGMLYGLWESAGGNTELRWDPFDLATGAFKPGGDLYHNFYNIGSAHALTITKHQPMDGAIDRYQHFAANYRDSIGRLISNTTRGKGGDIAADERGRVYFGAVSAGELPIPFAANYGGTTGFNPYPVGSYLGGAYFVALNPDMSGREYATRLSFGYTHALDARIIGGDPANDPATIVFGGKDNLGGPMWLKNPLQSNPGYGSQDGTFTVLGGAGSSTGGTYQVTIADPDWPASSYQLNFRGVGPSGVTLDADGDGLVDDRLSGWVFSDTVPLSDGNPLYTGLPIYGGLEMIRLDTTSGENFSSSRSGFKSSGFGIGTVAPAVDANLFVYVDKKDFPGINASDLLSFSTATLSSINSPDNRQWGGSRFVVRDGDTFYVNEDQNFSRPAQMLFSARDDDGRWAEWDPASDLEFDQDNAVFVNRNFKNITAIGLLLDRDSSSNSIGLYTVLSVFSFEFEVNGAGSTAPVAAFEVSPQQVLPGETISLDATTSYDPDGEVTFYSWNFNDDGSASSSGPAVTTSYAAPGNYKPVLFVHDANLLSDNAFRQVWVSAPAERGADASRVFASYDGSKSRMDYRSTTQKGLDLDGDGLFDDGRVGGTFSETNPLEARRSTSLYGGAIMEIMDSSTVLFNELRWDDYQIVIRPHPGDSGATNRVHALMFIDKSDFINGAEYGSVGFDAASYLETNIGRNVGGWPIRWVVRDSTGYAVSQQSFTSGTVRLTNPESVLWAPYDPASDLNFDQDNAVFASRSFNDISAIGVLVEQDDLRTSSGWLEIRYILAEGAIQADTNVPSPVPAFSTSPANPNAGSLVAFDASASIFPGELNEVRWDFGDGSFLVSNPTDTIPVSLTADHAFQGGGTYPVTLTLTSSNGESASLTQHLVVSGPNALIPRLAVTPTNGVVPLTVSLDASTSQPSEGATLSSFDWVLGDGTTSSGSSPTLNHTFTTNGTYNVMVTVTDSLGKSGYTVVPVVVGISAPLAVIDADKTTGGRPLTVNFSGLSSTAGSGSIASYEWDFGDGFGTSGAEVSHTYLTAGLYTASLTVRNSQGGVAIDTVGIEVLPNDFPTAFMTASTTSGALPLMVSFDAAGSFDPDGTIIRYDWDFGDGSTLSDGGPSPSYSYTTFGTYIASVTVYDDLGGSDTATIEIIAGNEPPVANFIASTPLQGFIPLALNLDASGSSDIDGNIVTYDWDFGDGNTALDAGPNVSHTYTTEGSFLLSLTVTDNQGASDTISQTVTASVSASNALLYHYTFDADGGAGTSVSDESGEVPLAAMTTYSDTGITADLFGTDTPDGSGFGMDLTGFRSHGRVPQEKYDDVIANGSEEISVVFKVKLTAVSSSASGGGDDDRTFFRMGGNSAGIVAGTKTESPSTPDSFRLGIGINTKTPSVYTSTRLDISTWKVLAITWQAGEANIYLGDDYASLALVETLNVGGSGLNTAGEPLWINSDSHRAPKGHYDDFMIFSNALDITNLRALGGGGPAPEPVAPVNVQVSMTASDWVLQIPTQTGLNYRVLTSSDLSLPTDQWVEAVPETPGTGSLMPMSVDKAAFPAAPSRFFSVEVTAP